jgi:hypothetical protein
MQNELENKLAEIETQIIAIENGDIKNEVLMVSGEDFKEGYLHALFEMKEWFEGMIANCE